MKLNTSNLQSAYIREMDTSNESNGNAFTFMLCTYMMLDAYTLNN